MRSLSVFLALILFLPLLRSEDANTSASVRIALLAWEATPERVDVKRVADDLVAIAQADLTSEPGFTWVERAELDKLLAETALAFSGRLDSRSALRVGKLARAQLLVTGRLDAADHAQTLLTLEVIDLERGDLLVSSVTPLPTRPHKHYALREEDRVAAVSALRSLLQKAASRQRELEAQPAVAFLFLANTGPSSRLESAGGRLAEKLRVVVEQSGGRVLRFPRAHDAEGEQDLAVLGLAEADDQAWRSVADVYVWGEYKEIPSDGLAFEQTPVEVSLTLWDGASPLRVETWRGTVGTWVEGEKHLATAISSSIRRASSVSSDARAKAAGLLFEQVRVLEKNNTGSMETPGFWASESGRNFQNYRLYLLQSAAFLEPNNANVRRTMYSARWDSRAWGGEMPVNAQWRYYADSCIITDRFQDSRRLASHYRGLRVSALEAIMKGWEYKPATEGLGAVW
jgi:hypothetical protein